MTYGDFPQAGSPGGLLIPSGAILNRDLTTIHPVNINAPDEIQEFIAHSWYDYQGGKDTGLHPYVGETTLAYSGPTPPYTQLDVAGSYSWLKSPRWKGNSMEVGPLARVLMLYATGHEPTIALADSCTGATGPAADRDVLDNGPRTGGADAGEQDHRRPDAGLV